MATPPNLVGNLIQFRVKYKDLLHLRNLYVMIHEYLLEDGWNSSVGPGHEYMETLYSENSFQKGIHFGGKEMWIWWRTTKKMERKYSTSFINHLDVDFHVAYLRDQEIVHQGKKMKIQWGEIEIFFRAWVDSPIKTQWQDHWFLKHFKDIYLRRMMHQEIEKREKELWREAYRLQAKVKQFLNLRTFVPITEPFHPQLYGYEE